MPARHRASTSSERVLPGHSLIGPTTSGGRRDAATTATMGSQGSIPGSAGTPNAMPATLAFTSADEHIEHGSALIHTLKFGDHFRKAANATTLLPAVEKRGATGVVFDIPLKHVTDATIRSHHQTVDVRIADAPHADEIVVALAAAAQGRPQQRLAPLTTEQ